MNEFRLVDIMDAAEYVQLGGVVFHTEYLRVPDEWTVAHDVVMELKRGDYELEFTRDELDRAEYIGQGAYRLKSGSLLRLLNSANLH